MKKTKILYWGFTAFFSVLMLFSSIPGLLHSPDAIAFMTTLGYPPYFSTFIGVAKILGVIGILVPGYPRLTEWAYAGLVFDLAGATYSQAAVGSAAEGYIFMLLCFVLAFGSYYFYHKRLKERSTLNDPLISAQPSHN